MFRHVVDNDPRPHYIHQSNLADYNPALPETHPARAGSPTRSSAACWRATSRLRPGDGTAGRAHAHADRPDARAAERVGGEPQRDHGVAGRRPRPCQERRHGRGRRAAHRHDRRRALRRREVRLDHARARGRAGARADASRSPRPAGRSRHRAERRRDDTTRARPLHRTGDRRRRKPRATRAEADQGQDVPAALRGLAQASRPGDATGRHAVTFKVNGAATVRLSVQRRTSGPPYALGRGRHGHPLGQGRQRRGPPHRALRQAPAAAARVPPRGDRQAGPGRPRTAAKRISFRVVKG